MHQRTRDPMQRTFIRVVSLTLIVGACALSRGQLKPLTRPAPISLPELHDRGVLGRLGRPLGTVVEVSGTVVVNDARAKGHDDEPFLLQVETVDGHKLVEPQAFFSSDMPLIRERPSLKVGDAFKCAGYERGGYQGSPEGESRYVPPYAARAFSFVVDFVVVKSL